MSSNLVRNDIDSAAVEQVQGVFPAQSGHQRVDSGFRTGLSTAHTVRLLYLSAGTCIIRQGKREHLLRQNDAFFVFPDSPCQLLCESAGTTEFWWLDLFGPSVDKILQQLSVSAQKAHIQGIANPNFLREIRSIVIRYDDLLPHDLFSIMGSLYKLLSILLEECTVNEWIGVPHDDPGILYTGVWTAWPSPFCQQHEEFYTASPRAFAEYNFYGTGIKWFGTLNFDCGRADVIIDGIYQTTVDAYNPNRLAKQLLYTNTKLPEGHHIIKIFCTGERNDKATNCDVVVESFQYLARVAEQEHQPQRYNSGIVKQAVEMMKSSYTTGITVDAIAERLNVSRTYFTTRFKEEMGVPPAKYLTFLRMSHAKSLLCTTATPVGEVASAVGIGDAFYFSRLFKKEENLTPTQYRELNRGAGGRDK